MSDDGFDDDWDTEDDLASLPGCLQARRIEPPASHLPTTGGEAERGE